MLRYLLLFDKDIHDLKNNDKGFKIFMRPIYMGFGLMQLSTEQAKELNDELDQFHKCNTNAVFVFYIGALNHWVTLVVHKIVTQKEVEKEVDTINQQNTGAKGSASKLKEEVQYNVDLKFYLLDSMNFEILDYSDKEVPEFINQKAKERVLVGIKPMNHFTMKMTI